jgi:hypothetical protein
MDAKEFFLEDTYYIREDIFSVIFSNHHKEKIRFDFLIDDNIAKIADLLFLDNKGKMINAVSVITDKKKALRLWDEFLKIAERESTFHPFRLFFVF